MQESPNKPQNIEIDHSEIFSSPEKFQEMMGSSPDEGGVLCRSFQLPSWHPFKRPTGIIVNIERGEKYKVTLAFPINPAIDLETSIKNKWMITEVFEETFEVIKSYFVNGTLFADNDGQYVITNGPKRIYLDI